MAMLTVQVDEQLLADLDTIADDQSATLHGTVSRSAVVRQALVEHIARLLPPERRARAQAGAQAPALEAA